jgi:metallo-beta-lactamase family protein
MRIVFFGAARTVTGAAFRIECEEAKILLDCGLFQGPRELEERNRRVDLYGPATTSAVVLSHAHMDHAGLLPAFVASGFAGGPFTAPPQQRTFAKSFFSTALISRRWRPSGRRGRI